MVEIFTEPELENLDQQEVANEWFGIASDLGMDKQISLADKSEDKKAPPYSFIDPKTERIIRTLCPEKVKYDKYDVSTIPVDVLKEIKKCVDNNWYQHIYIFYDNQTPDPFVVGYLQSDYEWNAPKHMIARWGAELLPFEQLELKAIQRLAPVAKKALNELLHKVQYGVDNVEDFISLMLAGDQKPELRFNVGDLHNTFSLPF